jgi:hypothetical protein
MLAKDNGHSIERQRQTIKLENCQQMSKVSRQFTGLKAGSSSHDYNDTQGWTTNYSLQLTVFKTSSM